MRGPGSWGGSMEKLLHAILDNSPSAIFLKDIDGCYVLVNKEFQRAFGVTQEKVRGKKADDVFPLAQAKACRDQDLRVLQERAPIEFEVVVPGEDGPHTSIVQKFPLYDANGEIYATG